MTQKTETEQNEDQFWEERDETAWLFIPEINQSCKDQSIQIFPSYQSKIEKEGKIGSDV